MERARTGSDFLSDFATLNEIRLHSLETSLQRVYQLPLAAEFFPSRMARYVKNLRSIVDGFESRDFTGAEYPEIFRDREPWREAPSG